MARMASSSIIVVHNDRAKEDMYARRDEDERIFWPMISTPWELASNIDKKLFCDEWFLFPEDYRVRFTKRGIVYAAIGTVPWRHNPYNPVIECLPWDF